MKFRTDFVTNSSSSSFIAFNIQSIKMAEIASKYESLTDPDLWNSLSVDKENGTVSYYEDESGYYELYLPNKNVEGLCDAIIELFDEIYCNGWNEDIDEEEAKAFIQELKDNKTDIIETLESVDFELGESGWQGDSDCRMYKDWYEKDHLDGIYEYLAEEYNCEVKDVTDEMFYDYVVNQVSIETNTISYNKKNGKIKQSRTTKFL